MLFRSRKMIRQLSDTKEKPEHSTFSSRRGPSQCARVARVQGIARPYSFPFPLSLSPALERVVRFLLHSLGSGRLSFTARIERPQPYRGGSASTKDSLATPQSLLLLNLRPPYNVLVTPWLCDCFLSFAVAQRIRSECGLSIRRAGGLQRS